MIKTEEVWHTEIVNNNNNNNNNNLYCALDTIEGVRKFKGNICKEREHSHSEIARANRAERLGHAEKSYLNGNKILKL